MVRKGIAGCDEDDDDDVDGYNDTDDQKKKDKKKKDKKNKRTNDNKKRFKRNVARKITSSSSSTSMSTSSSSNAIMEYLRRCSRYIAKWLVRLGLFRQSGLRFLTILLICYSILSIVMYSYHDHDNSSVVVAKSSSSSSSSSSKNEKGGKQSSSSSSSIVLTSVDQSIVKKPILQPSTRRKQQQKEHPTDADKGLEISASSTTSKGNSFWDLFFGRSTTTRQQQKQQQSSSSSSSSTIDHDVSACLLVMDDNHFLSEWIPYHYHTLNLRNLIIATDPKSQTSPSILLEKWKDNHLMDITEWTSDDDYMSHEEYKHAQVEVLNYFGGPKSISKALVLHRARQRMFYYKCLQTFKENNKSWVLLIDTDEFLTINYDIIHNNIQTSDNEKNKNKNNTEIDNGSTMTVPLKLPKGLPSSPETPGSVIELIQQVVSSTSSSSSSSSSLGNTNIQNEQLQLKRGHTSSNSNINIMNNKNDKNNQGDTSSSSSSSSFDNYIHPLLFSLQSSPCIQIPRLRFLSTTNRMNTIGGNDSTNVTTTSINGQEDEQQEEQEELQKIQNQIQSLVSRSSPSESDIVVPSPPLLSVPYVNVSNFATLRWTHHVSPTDYKRNKISKTLIDISRIDYDDILATDFSIHLPIRKYCHQRKLHVRTIESLLTIHHYLGTYEQYTYRERDARRNNENDKEQQRDPSQFEKLHQQQKRKQNKQKQTSKKKQNLSSSSSNDGIPIRSWLKGFLLHINDGWKNNDTMITTNVNEDNNQHQKGRNNYPAKTNIHDISYNMTSPIELLRGVGELEPKSWTTFYGNVNEDRCALCFFGLPRAYKNMVLPSIIKNVLIPNARHNCDIYVHFYKQYEEVAGRKNRGGKVDPDQVFLLERAVHDIQSKYGPKYGRNSNRNPIIRYVHDTEEEFFEKRGKALKRYHDTVNSDGKPAYYPWKAKTYTNSSLDNIVRQWHSIEYAFKLMSMTGKQLNITYSRVAMLRSDVMYLTPIDVAKLDKNEYDSFNQHAVVAPFARFPINDRMVYGPYEAIEMWSTKRFQLIDQRAAARQDPGYEMHSERFLNASIFPLMEKRLREKRQRQLSSSSSSSSSSTLNTDENDNFTAITMNRDICFVRTRADESASLTDCTIGGMTRGWDNVNKRRLVEDIVQKSCTFYNIGFKWKFAGCGENIVYRDGKG